MKWTLAFNIVTFSLRSSFCCVPRAVHISNKHLQVRCIRPLILCLLRWNSIASSSALPPHTHTHTAVIRYIMRQSNAVARPTCMYQLPWHPSKSVVFVELRRRWCRIVSCRVVIARHVSSTRASVVDNQQRVKCHPTCVAPPRKGFNVSCKLNCCVFC